MNKKGLEEIPTHLGDERVVIDVDNPTREDVSQSLRDNLNIFKTASDKFEQGLNLLHPSWDGTQDLSSHQNEIIADTYRAYRRARLGIDATLRQIAENNGGGAFEV